MGRDNWNKDKRTLLGDTSSICSHILLESITEDEINEYKDMLKDSDDWNVELIIDNKYTKLVEGDKFLKSLVDIHYKRLVDKQDKIINDRAKKMFEKKWSEVFGGLEESMNKARNILDENLRYDWE